MIATDYVTVQEQLLALSLYDETTAKTVAAIPTEQFDQWRQPIHGAISQTIKEDALLTRTGLKAYLNEHKPTPEFTPSDMAGQITIYNRLFMDGVTMKPDDAPPLISLLAKIKPSIPRISQLFEPFDMTKHFLASPKQIQRLAQLIYTICPKTPPVACFWLAMTLVGACCGKYIVGRNGTQKLYLNLWANILTPSGKGKSEIKEIQRLIEKAINEANPRTFSFLQDTFTFSYLFSDMGGGTVPSKKLAMMDELEKYTAMLEVDERSRKRQARLIISDELTFTFEKIIQSGTQSGELGKALQLADSGADINGSTSTDGYRKIIDVCVSLFGMTQISNWHNTFCSGSLSEKGLPQRFITVNPHHHTLALERLDLCQDAIEAEIIHTVKQIIDKVSALGHIICNIWNPQSNTDFVAAGWQSLLGHKSIAPFVEKGMVDLDAVDGKLKTQAVKMMLIHKFLDHPIPAPSLAPQDPTPTQVDWIDEIVYKNYLGLLMVNYCKHATTTIVDPEVLKINQKIITLLAKAPNHTMTQRDIFLKVKNRTDIKYTRDLDDYIIALRDNGIIKISKHGNGITAPVYCSWIATTKHVEQS